MLLTKTSATQWPLQLRMPTLESEGSSATPYGVVGTTLLRRHKTLPHPRQQQVNVISPEEPSQQRISLDTNLSSSPESPSSHTLKHSSKKLGAPSLPLTPPAQTRQVSTGLDSFKSANEDIPPAAPSVPGTPPNQQSPPTPDVTPPKAAWRTSALRPLANDRYPSSRADSFKTAKETQTPNQSDEDEFFRLYSAIPSPLPSSQETVQWAPIEKLDKPIGLGLGLESDNDGSITPTPARGQFVLFDGEWGSGTEDISEVEREWDDNLMRNVTVRKRPVFEAFNASPAPRIEVRGDTHDIKPSNATKQLKGLNLQEKVVNPRRMKDENRMKEKSAVRSMSPAVVRESEFSMSDVRRFSTLSGRSQASTIVEAMVVDTPAIKLNALRRTKKRSVLRDISLPERSLREVSRSPDLPHRLVHKNSRIPERRQTSLGSTGTGRTVSTTSSSGQSRKEIVDSGGIPVVIVPERSSSSKAKTPSLRSSSSRHTRGSRSVSGASIAPLSTSAKTIEPEYFDLNPRRKKRANSDTAVFKSWQTSYDTRTFDIEPIVPVRTSSLSATTSRNNSRAGSLTAESLRAHNESLAPLFPPRSTVQSPKRPTATTQTGNHAVLFSALDHAHSERKKSLDHNGDPLFGNRVSTQNTPFSQISYATSGTGAEVSEALAVPLYPHRNDSLLMIQQQRVNHAISKAHKSDAHQMPKELAVPALDTVEEKITPIMRVNDEPIAGPVTPPQPFHSLSMGDVDSPLRNPRQAPEPPQLPAIKFIPPTPASTEDDRQLGHGIDMPQETLPPLIDEEAKPKRGFSLVRKALNKRRYSEGFIVGWSRRFSLRDRNDFEESPPGTSRSNAVVDPLYPATDIPSDTSRLHPFWRPARFWDDLENYEHSDDEDDDEPQEYGRVLYANGSHPSVETRPTMPKRKFSLKRTFAILPIKDDHGHLRYSNESEPDRRTVKRSPSGNMRVVKKTASNTSLRRATEQGNFHSQRRAQSQRPATSDGVSVDSNGKFHTIPGIGIRFEYVGFKGLQARLRERNNKRLKSRISGPKGAWHGDDAVLGNGFPQTSAPTSRVVRNGDGFVVVTRDAVKGKAKERDRETVDGNGGLGEEI